MHSALPSTPEHTINPRSLRDTLGSFVTGITIVTSTAPNGEPIGLTVNSFNSVSLDPPLILWSLSRTSPHIDNFCATKNYAINILSSEQEDLSQRFATRDTQAFTGINMHPGINGAPIIHGCCANLECTNHAHYPGGDHLIFVGEIIHLAHYPERLPLLYYAGNYHQLSKR